MNSQKRRCWLRCRLLSSMIPNFKLVLNWEKVWPLLDRTFLSFIEVTGGVRGHAICRDGTIYDGFNLFSAHGASQQNLIWEPSP